MVERDHVDQDAMLGAWFWHDLQLTTGDHLLDGANRDTGIGAIALDGFDRRVDLECKF